MDHSEALPDDVFVDSSIGNASEWCRVKHPQKRHHLSANQEMCFPPSSPHPHVDDVMVMALFASVSVPNLISHIDALIKLSIS